MKYVFMQKKIAAAGFAGDKSGLDSIVAKYGRSFEDATFQKAVIDAEAAIAARKEEASKAAAVEKEKREAEAVARAAEQEAAAKAEADRKAHNVPGNVAEIGKKIMVSEYVDSVATPDGNGGWTIHFNGYTKSTNQFAIRKAMMDLAIACHPKGMTVSDFSVSYQSDFDDGLGNEFKAGLVKCRIRKEIREKINWQNAEALSFDRIFETEFCAKPFKADWQAAARP